MDTNELTDEEKRNRDAMALAQLIYDIYQEQKLKKEMEVESE